MLKLIAPVVVLVFALIASPPTSAEGEKIKGLQASLLIAEMFANLGERKYLLGIQENLKNPSSAFFSFSKFWWDIGSQKCGPEVNALVKEVYERVSKDKTLSKSEVLQKVEQEAMERNGQCHMAVYLENIDKIRPRLDQLIKSQ